MAKENHLKTRIRRIIRRCPLSSCRCKDLIAADVAAANTFHLRSPELQQPLLSDGPKCPPSSPIIIQKEKKTLKTYIRKHMGVPEASECMYYNTLFRNVERLPVEQEEKCSLAVVKRSSDPYGDFRASMVEMIVEKEIFGERDLENLLECFLSLNSRHHHRVILQAFAEIWEALLP